MTERTINGRHEYYLLLFSVLLEKGVKDNRVYLTIHIYHLVYDAACLHKNQRVITYIALLESNNAMKC